MKSVQLYQFDMWLELTLYSSSKRLFAFLMVPKCFMLLVLAWQQHVRLHPFSPKSYISHQPDKKQEIERSSSANRENRWNSSGSIVLKLHTFITSCRLFTNENLNLKKGFVFKAKVHRWCFSTVDLQFVFMQFTSFLMQFLQSQTQCMNSYSLTKWSASRQLCTQCCLRRPEAIVEQWLKH